MNSNYQRASKLDIFKYSFGGVGSNIAFMAVMGYLTYFYTDIFGIPIAATASLMLIARLIDAVTDPLMGMLSDQTKTKLGKFRPYIIFGAPLLGLSMVLLFTAPELSDTGKLVYAYITYIGYSLASTIVNIPYHSLTPVMSQDPDQRTTIAVSKQMMALPAVLFVQVLTLPIVGAFGNDANAWTMYAVISAVLMTLSFWLCAAGAKKSDNKDTVLKKTEKIPFKTQMQTIYKNKPLIMLLIAFGTDLIASSMAQGVNMYYFLYVIGDTSLIPIIGMAALLPPLIVMPFLPKLSRIFGKKKLFVISNVLACAPLSFLLITGITDPQIVMITLIISTIFASIPGTMGWAMLPDCVEYAQWKTGIRAEGTVSSTLTFVNKLGMAIGGSLVGIVLASVGYVANAAQAPEVLDAIVLLKFLGPILGYVCSLIAMFFYEINNEFYKKISDEIKERNNKNTNI